MSIILSSILSGIISFALGWFLCKSVLQKNFDSTLITQKIKQKNQEKRLLNEQKIISEQFFSAHELKMEQQADKLNFSFLENGKSIEAIGKELKNAQKLVTNAFSSLPIIHTCSQKTYQTALESKNKVEALSQSVDSWQGSMESLQNIHGLIDAIHEKATQIRDVSSEANLLALNASIEAARAGEHGRGFAVVATSMRDLSNKSAEATVDINTAVEKTRTEVAAIISGISENVSLLTKVSSNVAENFVEIENEVSNIATITQTSLSEAKDSDQQFKKINSEVNNQLESIIGLLAKTLGEVTGNTIRNISVNADFSKMQIIDVRSQEEYTGELGHIENAKLICLNNDFKQQLQQLDKKIPYLFVCRSGGRSSKAAKVALEIGFTTIYNMQGGMLEFCKVMGTPSNASVAPITKTNNIGQAG